MWSLLVLFVLSADSLRCSHHCAGFGCLEGRATFFQIPFAYRQEPKRETPDCLQGYLVFAALPQPSLAWVYWTARHLNPKHLDMLVSGFYCKEIIWLELELNASHGS